MNTVPLSPAAPPVPAWFARRQRAVTRAFALLILPVLLPLLVLPRMWGFLAGLCRGQAIAFSLPKHVRTPVPDSPPAVSATGACRACHIPVTTGGVRRLGLACATVGVAGALLCLAGLLMADPVVVLIITAQTALLLLPILLVSTLLRTTAHPCAAGVLIHRLGREYFVPWAEVIVLEKPVPDICLGLDGLPPSWITVASTADRCAVARVRPREPGYHALLDALRTHVPPERYFHSFAVDPRRRIRG